MLHHPSVANAFTVLPRQNRHARRPGPIALLIILPVFSWPASQARSDTVSFEHITLSTDLVAEVVGREDDIPLDVPFQAVDLDSAVENAATAGNRGDTPGISESRGDDAGNVFSLAADSTTPAVEPTADTADDDAGNVFSQVAESTTPAVEPTADTADDDAGNVFSQVAESATPAVEPAADTADDDTGNVFSQVADSTTPAVEPTADTADDDAGNVFSLAADSTTPAVEPTADTADDDAGNVFSQVAESTTPAVEPTADTADDDAGNVFSQVADSRGTVVAGELFGSPAADDLALLADTASAGTVDTGEISTSTPPSDDSLPALGETPVTNTVPRSPEIAMAGPALTIPSPAPLKQTDMPGTSVSPLSPDQINEDLVILDWATAWSNNDTEAYLSFYADEFAPPQAGQSRQEWEAMRRRRLQNQEIRIIVSNAGVHEIRGNVVEVRFTQRYTSRSYKDRVIKAIEMIPTEDGWRFISEREIEALPFE